MSTGNIGNMYVGVWPFIFGGWLNRAAKIHDGRYDAMLAGTCSMTLDQVDGELLKNLLTDAHKGFFQSGKIAQAYVLYGIAHAYGLIFWKGKR